MVHAPVFLIPSFPILQTQVDSYVLKSFMKMTAFGVYFGSSGQITLAAPTPLLCAVPY